MNRNTNFSKPWLVSVNRRVAMVQAIRDDIYRSMQTEEGMHDQGLREYYRRLQRVIARHAVLEEIDERRARTRHMVAVLLATGTDFIILHKGSIMLFRPLTDRARRHVRDVIDAGDGEIQGWGGDLVVEPRYAQGVVEALRHEDNGFRVDTNVRF